MDVRLILFEFLLAVSLGALTGFERDGNWRNKGNFKSFARSAKNAARKFSFIKAAIPADSIGGVRTYVLISVLGAVAGLAYAEGVSAITWIITAGLVLFIHISFILNYFDKNSFGLTTEISLILNYILSFLLLATDIPPRIIVAIAVFDTIILSLKDQLHNVVGRFSREEVSDTIKFVLFTLVILPFLPDASYGLGDIPGLGRQFTQIFGEEFVNATAAVNPFRIWMVVVLVLGLNYVGYFITKMLGKGRGLGMMGMLGGLVSSTAVTDAMSRYSKSVRDRATKDSLINATVLSNVVQFPRILIIAFIVNLQLGLQIAMPMLVMGGFLLLWVLVESVSLGKKKSAAVNEDLKLSFASPFALAPALKFAVLFLAVTLFTKLALFYSGDSGFLLSAMISAMSGLDAVTITTANLAGKEVTYALASMVLIGSACINLIIKIIFSALNGDKYFVSKIAKLFVVDIFLGILSILGVLLI